ncbi:MAG: ribonuclease H-like YkuK family protein [Candidatus Pacebacteria bacterium]|nr:ribonuclease H-like YkuK family protein [Candidatus Paceibacterota bacterium]
MPDFLNSSLGTKLTVPEVIQEIMAFMGADLLRRYKVTIGTDSELLSNKNADFVTAIVVHRIGNGGRYFYRRFELGTFHTLRDRMIKEALISLEVAQGVLAELKKFPLPEFDFEIHADIGEHGPTRAVIQEIVGMIRANNFEVKIKPDSYAATNVADKHV